MMRFGRRGRRGKEWRRCPRCGSQRSLPIVYGLPTKALEEEAARGEVVLGGCDVDGREPTRQCRACGHAWRPGGAGAGEGPPPAEGAGALTEGGGAPSDPFAGEEPERFELEVDAPALREALTLFEGWLSELQWDARAVLWLEGAQLVVRFGNDEARVRARGTWPGMVAAQSALVASIREELEGCRSFRLAVEGDRLWLGPRLRIRCEQLPAGRGLPRYVELHEPPRLLECVLLGLRHEPETLRHSGIERLVAGAQETLDEVVDDLEFHLDPSRFGEDVSEGAIAEAIRYFVRRGVECERREGQGCRAPGAGDRAP